MDQNASLNQNVETLFANLEEFTQNEGVLGKPVTHGDKTFIPVVSVTLGYGTGNTGPKGQQNQQQGQQGQQGTTVGAAIGNMGMGALGLGARLNTEAIVIIDKDNVSVMSLGATANASSMMDKIPQMLAGMGGQGKQGQQGQQNQQGQQQ